MSELESKVDVSINDLSTVKERKSSTDDDWSAVVSASFQSEEIHLSNHILPILPNEHNCLQAVVLAVWDNIVGPKAKFIWTQKGAVESSGDLDASEDDKSLKLALDPKVNEAVVYVVRHTLHGELSRDYSTGRMDDELFVVADLGFLACSTVYGAKEQDQPLTPHSLSLILCHQDLPYYLALHGLCVNWLHRIVAKARILEQKVDEDTLLGQLSNFLLEFSTILQSLKIAGIDPKELVMGSFLDQLHQFPPLLLEKAVASHLQTLGCTIVIGESPLEINLMVQTLALFLQPKEQWLCRMVKNGQNWPFHCGLAVQGLLKDDSGETNISSQEVLCNHYPTTIVDLSQGKVRQTWPYNEHLLYHQKALREEAHSLWIGTQITSSPVESIFNKVNETGYLVKNFLNELFLLVCGQQREAIILRFRRQLEYRAYALIKCFEKIMAAEDVPSVNTLKRLKKMSDLEDENDFRIILAVAEKLRPGIYCAVRKLTPPPLF